MNTQDDTAPDWAAEDSALARAVEVGAPDWAAEVSALAPGGTGRVVRAPDWAEATSPSPTA